MSENALSFEQCIEMIRSDDALTFEEGFWSVLEQVPQHINEIIQLLQSEQNPFERAKFVELLGAANSKDIIPVLVQELEHPHRSVREWAVLSLEELGFPEALELANNYKAAHPEEWG